MPSPADARMDALTEAIVRLLKRVERLEDQIARLEQHQRADDRAHAEQRSRTEATPADPLQAAPLPVEPRFVHAPPPPLPPPLPMSEPLPVFEKASSEIPRPAAATNPTAPASADGPEPLADPASHPQFETRMGLTWINRIGAVTLMIGVAFFFKYAIDNQWIGETGRVLLGVFAGLATIAAGDLLWRRGQQIFAQGLCGLGIGILYLSFYASFGFYRLLPQAPAFLLMAMVTALAGALALRYDAMAIAALGMLGGYLTPVLLSTGQDAPWTLFSYLFLLGLGAVAIARPRRWRPLDLMAFIATIIIYAAWFGEWFRPERQVVATVAALGFYLLFVFVEWSGIFYAAQVIAGLALAAIWADATPFLLLSIMLGATGLVIPDRMFVPGQDRAGDPKRGPAAAMFSFLTFWGAYGLWRSSHGRPEETVTTFLLLTLAFAMYLAWTPLQVMARRAEIGAPHLTVMALNGVVYFACSYWLLELQDKAWMGLLAAVVAGVYLLLGGWLWTRQQDAGGDTRPVLLALGIAVGFLTLAAPIQFTGFTITLSWALEAAALLWISRRANEDRLLLAAAVVYLLVFLRLYGFDAWGPAEGRALIVNTRALTFVVSAVSFWLAAWWMRPVRAAAAAAYVTGHFILLSICLLEFGDWVATAVSIGDQASLFAIGISLLMALYAVLLIGIGVGYRSPLDRILGLGLIGIVVGKLYLYDVWEASRLFRMAAFVALGVLLLLTSYLYSRFRPAIGNWWKDDEAPK